MADPWEMDWSAKTASAPVSNAPWDQNWSNGAPQKSFTEKLGETWPARIAKGIYQGVTLPGDVYQGNTAVDPSNPEFMGRVMDLATVATPTAPKVGATVAASTAAVAPTIQALDEAANQGYKTVRSSPYAVDSAAVGDLSRNIQSELNTQGRTDRFAPETHGVLADYQKAHPDSVATGGNLATFREALRQASQNFTNPREAAAANKAIEELDRFIKEPPAQSVVAGSPAEFATTYEGARGNYAAARRAETVQNELETAHRNAAVANSGRNIDNAQRQRINALTKSERKSQGFSDEELAQMDRVIFGTGTGNAMRTAGNMLGGGGGLGAAIVGGVGATFNPFLAATPLAGALLKKGADFSTLRQIKALDEMVRARSPLAAEAPEAAGLTAAEQLQRAALIKALLTPQPTQP